MPGFLSVLADLLGIPPIPGTAKYRDALHRCMKQRNEELDKPAEQRDAARLLELTKRVLRMRINMFRVQCVRGACGLQLLLGCVLPPPTAASLLGCVLPPPTAASLLGCCSAAAVSTLLLGSALR